MTREELRAVLVERALAAWEPDDWPWPPSPIDAAKHSEWTARCRARMGAVIDALGILDAAEALEGALVLINDIMEEGFVCPDDNQRLGRINAALRRIRGEP